MSRRELPGCDHDRRHSRDDPRPVLFAKPPEVVAASQIGLTCGAWCNRRWCHGFSLLSRPVEGVQHAGSKAGHRADLVAAEGEHQQPARLAGLGWRAVQVGAEGELPAGLAGTSR